jgi:hypothetical protein
LKKNGRGMLGHGGLHLIILAFRRLRQEDSEFEASLGDIVTLCLKNKKQKIKEQKRKI